MDCVADSQSQAHSSPWTHLSIRRRRRSPEIRPRADPTTHGAALPFVGEGYVCRCKAGYDQHNGNPYEAGGCHGK
ncbi:hypothetical protein OsI_39156 [Oryza sativa Indica Group]|uniref:Uncharacterized protein n=1 Tax=Oryza sativa subsp. indica TaxID=39946 RepID=B8BN23_ORYSI|nr:hypothetical protein OsI_39156 [Oryza sativa Indica Group]